MNSHLNQTGQSAKTASLPLAESLKTALSHGGLEAERAQILGIVAELGIDVLDCASALLRLLKPTCQTEIVASQTLVAKTKPVNSTIKMVRYRLDIGSQHQLNAEILKKVLVEESGVDKKNINAINIQGLYTLIELPDAMPPDIFQHLKMVEINHRKLDIKRLKNRNKKRGKSRNPREKLANSNGNVPSSQNKQAISAKN